MGGVSRLLAEMRPHGYDKRELRVLVPAATEALPLLQRFVRDAAKALKSGTRK